MINSNTPAIDIQTTLLVVRNFFPPVVDSSEEEGPSACFAGVFPDDGDVGVPGITCVVVGGVNGDVGAGTGEAVVLKRFPSFLHEN